MYTSHTHQPAHEVYQKVIRLHLIHHAMNLDEIYSKLEGKITKEELKKRIKEKIDEFGGLLSEEGAALIVAADLGVDLQVKRPQKSLSIKDLAIGMSDICVCARVMCISAIKEFERDTGTGKVANVEVRDATGSTRVVLWDDLADFSIDLQKGDIIEIRGGYIKKGYREGIEIHASSSQRVTLSKKSETEKDLPDCVSDFTCIEDLTEEITDVDVVGRVKQIFGIREFQKNGGTGKIASVIITDDTGDIRLCLWNDKADLVTDVKRGDIIAVENGYIKMGLNDLELHSGWRGRVIVNPDVNMPELPDLPDVERSNIIDLEPQQPCNVRGTITGIGEKRSFVKQDGSSGQLASFDLQDDTAEIRVVLWNEKADIVTNLVEGLPLLIDNAYVRKGREGLEVHVSSVGEVVIDEHFEPEHKISTLEEGSVTVVGRFYQGGIIDESGRVKFSEDVDVKEGKLITVKGVYDTETITIDTIEESNEKFPSLESLLHPPRKIVSEVVSGEFVEVFALVKKVLSLKGYNRVTLDDGTGEVMGIVMGDVVKGEEYCFYARVYKRETGVELVCYQYHVVEAEKEAFNVLKELEGLVEV